MRTEVCITIDTEFSIGGAFADPRGRRPIGEPNVTCYAGNRENGLGFLLENFIEYGIEATFFVESLQTIYFGSVPMGRVVERILSAGQDIELHIHPCWWTFRDKDWTTRIAQTPPNDCCDGRTIAEMCALIGEGIERLLRLGAPQPIALRTGNLRADRTVYEAMPLCGLRLASNLGIGVFKPEDPKLQLEGGRHWIGNVLEVPVLTYRQLPLNGRRGLRMLAITAASWRETEALLWQARERGVRTIVILTHPFEYVKGDRQYVNHINKRRLKQLCAFLAAHPAEFATPSFRRAADAWLAAPDNVPAPTLKAPLHAVMLRMVENATNDRFMRL